MYCWDRELPLDIPPFARGVAANAGATRSGPYGVTFDDVATQGQVCELCFIGLPHGPDPRDRRACHCGRPHGSQAHQCGAGLLAHAPHASAHPPPVLCHVVVGPQLRGELPLGLASVTVLNVMPQLAETSSSSCCRRRRRRECTIFDYHLLLLTPLLSQKKRHQLCVQLHQIVIDLFLKSLIADFYLFVTHGENWCRRCVRTWRIRTHSVKHGSPRLVPKKKNKIFCSSVIPRKKRTTYAPGGAGNAC